ncbi:Bug family tripartite tricarboxylate transporter substrate binding protein [Ottowia thiooxydans]|uniref:Tripartite-type tricarboxylate transporter receptor subunit TctC n=1 Tax=Ottowia thiooxydans TaxID=219182 RepID=A0ABV2Q6F8_9BURK
MALSLRRRLLMQSAAASVFCPVLPGFGQAPVWPNRIVRFVSQSGAGDPVDLRMRDFMLGLAPLLGGATLVPDNKPGAGGVLAHQSVLNAPADGNSVLLGNASMTILPSFNRKLPYSPQNDLVPVAIQGLSPIGLAIPASRPEKTLKEWLQYARRQSGQLNYSSVGNGSPSHLYGFQLADDMGFQATHIPFKGGNPGLLAMLAGDVQYGMYDTFTLRPLLTKNSLRVLAVTGDERSKFLPDVPTFKELGHAGYERMGWTGYFFKAGTAQSIVDRLAQSINQLNGTPEWAKKREDLWSSWRAMSPAVMARQVKSDTEAWAAIVQKTGVYAD